MKIVANYFNLEALREGDKDDFYLNLPKIREILGDRAVLRAMHLFEENKRVDLHVHPLKKKNFDTFKKLIKESGDSSFNYLQNVYSSHDLTNQSVSIGLAISDISLGDKGVSRVHGGGLQERFRRLCQMILLVCTKRTWNMYLVREHVMS